MISSSDRKQSPLSKFSRKGSTIDSIRNQIDITHDGYLELGSNHQSDQFSLHGASFLPALGRNQSHNHHESYFKQYMYEQKKLEI